MDKKKKKKCTISGLGHSPTGARGYMTAAEAEAAKPNTTTPPLPNAKCYITIPVAAAGGGEMRRGREVTRRLNIEQCSTLFTSVHSALLVVYRNSYITRFFRRPIPVFVVPSISPLEPVLYYKIGLSFQSHSTQYVHYRMFRHLFQFGRIDGHQALRVPKQQIIPKIPGPGFAPLAENGGGGQKKKLMYQFQ